MTANSPIKETVTPSQQDAAQPSVSEDVMLNAIGLDSQCRNCQATLSEDSQFCPSCGQKRITQRTSFSRFLKDAPSNFFQLDRGLLLTILNMFIRPGNVARDYVFGMRKRYVNPFTYFLVGASIQLVSLWFSAGPMRATLEEQLGGRQLPNQEILEDAFDGDVVQGLGDLYLSAIAQSYTYAAALFFALPLALFLWIGHKAFDSKYYYGEVLVFSFYVVGHLLVMTAFVQPISIRISPNLASFTGPGVYLAYIVYAHGGFFRKGFFPRVISLGAMIGAMAVFFLSILVIFAGTLFVALVFKTM